MAITYPVTVPAAPGFKEINLSMFDVVAVSTSPFTLQEQVQEFDGQRWIAEYSVPPMTEAQAGPWEAFFGKVKGRRGTFLLGNPARTAPMGAGGGAPLIAGAGQTGEDIATDGWPVSTTVLLEGDHIQLGSGAGARLHKVLADATTDGLGAVTLTIWPAVRVAFPDNDPVVTVNAEGVFRLADNQRGWNVSDAKHYGFVLRAVSVI